jgi:hypothetical protein
MEKEQPTQKDRPEHKIIDPARRAARENRVPGKSFEPRRSEPESPKHQKDVEHDKH